MKAGIKDIQVGRSDTFRVMIDDIVVKPGLNCRDPRDLVHAEHLSMLSKSIEAVGLLEPLTVYMEDGKAVITDGHFRFEAAKLAIERGAPIFNLPVKMEPKGSSEADRVFSQVARNSGKRLLPMEQGVVFKKLIALGWEEAEIAAKAGISRTHVSNMVELQSAPQAIVDMVKGGKVAAGLALKTMKAADSEDAATATLQQAVETAESKGKTKATPKHVAAEMSPRDVIKMVKAAFESADIDNSGDDLPVLITMPNESYALVRDALKL